MAPFSRACSAVVICWPRASRSALPAAVLPGTSAARAQAASGRRRHAHPRPVAARRARAAGGLHALALGEPERAEGRRGRVQRARLLRQLQQHHPARHRGRRPRHPLRHAPEGERRRGEHGILPPRRRRSRCRPTARASPSSCGETARWHDGRPVTAEDVVWTFNTLRQHGRPFYRAYWADVTEVVAEGPRRVVFRFKDDGNRELALILGQMHRAAAPLVGGARLRPADARRAARLRPLPDRALRGGPQRRLSPRRGLLGARPADREGHEQLRHHALRVLPRQHRGAGGLQGRADRLPHREHRQGLGHRLRLPRRAARPGEARRDPPRAADGHAGLRGEPAPAAVPGRPRAPRADRGVRLRVDERQPVLRQPTRAPAPTSPTPNWRRAACREGREREILEALPRPRAGAASSPRSTSCPSPTAPATTARGSAARSTCCARPAGRCATGAW